MEKSKRITSKRDVLKAILGALIVILLIDLTPLGGNSIYYANWIRCGRQPVQNDIMIVGEVPHYITTKMFTVLRGLPIYFCSEIDAEKAGYSANPTDYDFPHLPASEFQNSIKKSQNRTK